MKLLVDFEHSLQVEQILLASRISNKTIEIITESKEHGSYPKPLLIVEKAILFPLQATRFLLESPPYNNHDLDLLSLLDDDSNLKHLIGKFRELPLFIQVIVFTKACLADMHKDPNLHEYLDKYGKINARESISLSFPLLEAHHAEPSSKMDCNSVPSSCSLQGKSDNNGKKRPIKGDRNILITAALPYVNNAPHLGNIIGAVLSADVYARYCRGRGWNVLFVCGTDEFGTATETKALEEGISCNDLCAKYFRLHASVYSWFECSFDHFGRTSNPHQTPIVHEIFWDLWNNGYFIEDEVEQTFCTNCDRFLADRYIEGTCPRCAFIDARGDQCDKCGHLINPIELVNPKCKICHHQPIVKSSKHLFLDLTKLQPQIESFVNETSKKGGWSHNSTSIAHSWLTEGLKPRCMTRDLKWGTSIPISGYENKVFYVWFDAPIGYLSICAEYDPEGWKQWWMSSSLHSSPSPSQESEHLDNGNSKNDNDAKVELYQFMGKDNVPFHTVIFPATLLGTQKPFTLLHHINTTEYLNYESGKFSKSRGVGVFGDGARDSGIGVSLWRYYLLSVRPENSDTAFSWDDFQAKINGELLANLGNFINRTTKFIYTKMNGIVPGITLSSTHHHSPSIGKEEKTEGQEQRQDHPYHSLFGTIENNFISNINLELKNYHSLMSSTAHIRSALKSVMTISSFGNQYLSESHLDSKLLENNPKYCEIVLTLSANLLCLLTTIMEPFIPKASKDLCTILNIPFVLPIPLEFNWNLLEQGHQIREPFILFKKLEDHQVSELREKFSGSRKDK